MSLMTDFIDVIERTENVAYALPGEDINASDIPATDVAQIVSLFNLIMDETTEMGVELCELYHDILLAVETIANDDEFSSRLVMAKILK